MELLYESKYYKIEIDNTTKLLKVTWSEESKNMSVEQMKEQISKAAFFIEELSPIAFLANAKKRNFIYPPETQQWIAETYGKACIKVGIKKFAIVAPDDLIAEFSTHQTAEFASDMPLEVKHFKSEETAINWLNT